MSLKDKNENEDAQTLNETSIYRGLSVLLTPLKLNNAIQEELLKEGIVENTKSIANETSMFQVHFGCNLILSKNRIDFTKVNPIPIIDVYDYRVLGKVTKTGDVIGKFRCQRLKGKEFEESFSLKNEEVFEKAFSRKKTRRTHIELSDQEWNADTGEFYFDIRVYDRGERI